MRSHRHYWSLKGPLYQLPGYVAIHRMAPVAVVVLASFSPMQLQSRTQIVFVPRACTFVLFIIEVIMNTHKLHTNYQFNQFIGTHNAHFGHVPTFTKGNTCVTSTKP